METNELENKLFEMILENEEYNQLLSQLINFSVDQILKISDSPADIRMLIRSLIYHLMTDFEKAICFIFLPEKIHNKSREEE